MIDEGEDWLIEETWRMWIQCHPRNVKHVGRFNTCKDKGYIKTSNNADEFWASRWRETTLAAEIRDEVENEYIKVDETLHMDNLL